MDPDTGYSADTPNLANPTRQAKTPSLEIEIVSLSSDWLDLTGLDNQIKQVGVAAFEYGKSNTKGPHQLTIALSNDEQVRKLNKAYRGKNRPTNVLSFPFGNRGPLVEENIVPLGDIILGFETIMSEAIDADIDPVNHICHLVAHGVLHLLGFDHEDEQEAQKMETMESEILLSLGFPDPYGHNSD